MSSPYFYLRVILVHSELNLAKFDQIYRKIIIFTISNFAFRKFQIYFVESTIKYMLMVHMLDSTVLLYFSIDLVEV